MELIQHGKFLSRKVTPDNAIQFSEMNLIEFNCVTTHQRCYVDVDVDADVAIAVVTTTTTTKRSTTSTLYLGWAQNDFAHHPPPQKLNNSLVEHQLNIN